MNNCIYSTYMNMFTIYMYIYSMQGTKTKQRNNHSSPGSSEQQQRRNSGRFSRRIMHHGLRDTSYVIHPNVRKTVYTIINQFHLHFCPWYQLRPTSFILFNKSKIQINYVYTELRDEDEKELSFGCSHVTGSDIPSQ